MTYEKDAISRFREAVRSIDAHRRLLIDSRASTEITDPMFAIIKHLHAMPDTTILRLIDGQRHRESLRSRRDKEVADAATMKLEEVERKLKDENTTRRQLETIAVGRFAVPSGSLRSLGTTEQLREKLFTLVQNERAHETITTLAKDSRF